MGNAQCRRVKDTVKPEARFHREYKINRPMENKEEKEYVQLVRALNILEKRMAVEDENTDDTAPSTPIIIAESIPIRICGMDCGIRKTILEEVSMTAATSAAEAQILSSPVDDSQVFTSLSDSCY